MEDLKENNYLKAYEFALDFAANKFRPFTSEDVKVAFQKSNPESIFSDFGSVMRELKHQGIILENGYVKAVLPLARGRVITRWISKNYSEQQSKNRSSTSEPIEDNQLKIELYDSSEPD